MIEADILDVLQNVAMAAIMATDQPDKAEYIDSRLKVIGITGPSPADGRFIEFVNIPNNRQGEYYDDSRTYQGNFRILLHWNVDASGAIPPAQFLDKIAAYYTAGLRAPVGNRMLEFYGKPDASGPIENGSELLFPLNLPYRCFAA